MRVVHCQNVEATPVQMEGAVGCQIRQLVTDAHGAPSFSMRQFEISSGGHTPKHAHAHEHEVYVLEGEGTVLDGDQEHPLRAGCAVLVPPNRLHQFRNTGGAPLKFLCLIPHAMRGMAGVCVAACGCE